MAAGLCCLANGVHAHDGAHASENAPVQVTGSGISDIGPMTQPVSAEVVREAVAPQLNPSVGGLWSDVYDWPLVAVHAALLPNGKVLAWDATPDDADDDPHTTDNYTTRVTLWDPVSDTHVQTNNDTDTDLFCAGSAHLWDGRILFAGGDGGRAGANGPLANTNIYNPVSNTWHRTQNMNAPRWYSSVAALSNGEMLTLGGTYNPQPLGEVFQFDQTWRALSGNIEQLNSEDYQWLQQTPEGSVLYFGPSNILVDIETEGSGTFTAQATRDAIGIRDYGSYAMYTTGKILVAGGEQGQSSSVVIDTATRQTVDTSPMNYGRRQHNLTILADGSVLVTGGNSDGTQYYSTTAGVFQPEIWNPDTGNWTVQNTMSVDRQYHSVALLLPDGTVLSAGGGICGVCYELGYEERNGDIFSPPYLFNADGSRATQPRMGLVPDVADYAEQIVVSLADSIDIEKAHLIKLGSVTHSENQDQRLVPLSFNRTARRLTLQMPDSRDVAPPGHYLMFAVDINGVPSEGSIIKLGQPLIGKEQMTRSTLEIDSWDTYLTEPVAGRASIELNAAAGTVLYVSDSAPVRADQQLDVLCTATVQNDGRASCEVSTSTGSQLHLSVTGTTRSDYALVYSDNEEITPVEPANPGESIAPEQPGPSGQTPNTGGNTPIPDSNGQAQPGTAPVNGTGKVRTGVGSITLSWVLMLLISVLIRPISYRIFRV